MFNGPGRKGPYQLYWSYTSLTDEGWIMKTMGSFEAKTHFSALLEQVERGQEFMITRHGHPVAKLMSIKPRGCKPIHQTILRLKALSQKSTLDGLDWKALRDEGRRL